MKHPIDHFDMFQKSMLLTLTTSVSSGVKLFKTNAPKDSLYNLYLGSVDDGQEHTCSCCRDFFNKYGDIVVVDRDGQQKSLLWSANSDVPDYYADFVTKAADYLHHDVLVSGVFLFQINKQIETTQTLGWRSKGGFNHFYIPLECLEKFG